MSDAYKGNIEILPAVGERMSLPGSTIRAEEVPIVLGMVHGITNLTEVTPEAVGSITPVAQWRGIGANGVPVVVKLWREPEPTVTFAGQVAAALAAEQRGG